MYYNNQKVMIFCDFPEKSLSMKEVSPRLVHLPNIIYNRRIYFWHRAFIASNFSCHFRYCGVVPTYELKSFAVLWSSSRCSGVNHSGEFGCFTDGEATDF